MGWTTVPTPVGELLLVGVEGALVKAHFAPFQAPDVPPSPDEPVLVEAARQLGEHFAGERTDFDLTLAPPGTAFQHRVWEELRRIPYGTTATYGEVAARLGDPKCVRAVGLANGRNPIAVVVPCHRVIGSDGKLRGYAGGIERKQRLLALENTSLF
ncbi:MAG: methylated-DNA/protein-cysteinemethyltransferase [Frankiales bacterium]|jgi:methylated-DNA-[protein]-cysteine S-methyltransferase|nr:methylated-DNA/protein-cysteinemethyltransferase [Frankiales bacterium]